MRQMIRIRNAALFFLPHVIIDINEAIAVK